MEFLKNKRNKRNKRNKKGVSTLVSVVLLIVFVISLGFVFVSWSTKLVGGNVEKSRAKVGSSLECADVNIRLEKGVSEGKIFVKNNDENPINGFVARMITTEKKALVDYKNKNTEIMGFGVFEADYSGDESGEYDYENAQGEISGSVNYDDIEIIEIIPRIEVDGVLVDCDMKKIKWEKF